MGMRASLSTFPTLAVILSIAGLSGCPWPSSGEHSANLATTSIPSAFNILSVSASSNAVKTFDVTWENSSGASTYQVCLYDTNETDNCLSLGSATTGTNQTVTLDDTRLNDDLDFFIIASNTGGNRSSSTLTASTANVRAAIGYFKASNTEDSDRFGYAVSLSSDGNTLAVGAYREDSDTTGVNNTPINNSMLLSGAVYVFVKSGSTWVQEAYVKPLNTGAGDEFGYAVSLDSDGNTLAVGAPLEDSSSIVVNGVDNDSSLNSGAVYVFTKSGTWSEEAYIKPTNTGDDDQFGYSVSLDSSGTTLAIGAHLEDSDTVGTVSTANDDGSANGAAYVFVKSGSWSQEAYIKADVTDNDDQFGNSVSLSQNGLTLAVGAYLEDSDSTVVDGVNNDDAANSGAVYVFIKSGTWSQDAYIKPFNTGDGDQFGRAVSLNSDGTALAVGADREQSNAMGVGGDETNDSLSGAGAAYTFTKSGGVWSQEAYIKASNTDADDRFGYSVSLSPDGNTLAVGAHFENSNATGINGNQNDDSSADSGAAYVFVKSGSWSQDSYLKATDTNDIDEFGLSLSLDSDGGNLVVGAYSEDSNATGVGGDDSNNTQADSGAVYLY
ncbi:FG-GAP repeat protein [Vibrio profundum]|uniref:FG-GAP repeat protein n=1 Tax=Vibrio profundum TaxID=2910247 RepID=UPI003D099B20